MNSLYILADRHGLSRDDVIQCSTEIYGSTVVGLLAFASILISGPSHSLPLALTGSVVITVLSFFRIKAFFDRRNGYEPLWQPVPPALAFPKRNTAMRQHLTNYRDNNLRHEKLTALARPQQNTPDDFFSIFHKRDR